MVFNIMNGDTNRRSFNNSRIENMLRNYYKLLRDNNNKKESKILIREGFIIKALSMITI